MHSPDGVVGIGKQERTFAFSVGNLLQKGKYIADMELEISGFADQTRLRVRRNGIERELENSGSINCSIFDGL